MNALLIARAYNLTSDALFLFTADELKIFR
jgi:hypothetical protein